MTSAAPITPVEASRHILEAQDQGRMVAVVLAAASAGPIVPGSRLLVEQESRRGTLGHPSADRRAEELARKALEGIVRPREGDAGGVGTDIPGEGLHLLQVPDLGTDPLEVYLEIYLPRPELLIVGAGHIARPLCTLGALLDFRVFVLDDRPRYATRERFPEAEEVRKVDFGAPFSQHHLGPWSHVVLVTRGHRYDYECLRHLLRAEPPPSYIGMIGSRRRVRATYVQLQEEGIELHQIRQVRAPVGLDLGAETPEEIAVSVAAELVLHRRGGSARPLSQVERVAERFFREEPKTEQEG